MSTRIYSSVLKGKFSELGYFVDETLCAAADIEFFAHIALYLVPLIRKSPVFDAFYFKWLKEKDEYAKEYAQLQAKIPAELEEKFSSLRSKLESNGYVKACDVQFKNETEKACEEGASCAIQHQVAVIATILKTKKPAGIPSYIYAAENEIRALLGMLLELGADDIIKDYCEVVPANIARMNIKTGNYEYSAKVILRFTFASSIYKLHEIENAYHGNSVIKYTWAAWDHLALVEWCWVTPFSFFYDKTVNFNGYESNNESQHWLMLHSNWCEFNKLKKGDTKKIAPFLERSLFVASLKLVINEIILQQGIEGSPIASEGVGPETITPWSVELKLNQYTYTLLLNVRWFEYCEPITCVIHSFQEGSGPYLFISELLQVPDRQRVKIPDGKVSGGSSAKYFTGMNLDGILKKLFFDKITTKTAAMKHKCIYGKDISKEEREELKKKIKAFMPQPSPLGGAILSK